MVPSSFVSKATSGMLLESLERSHVEISAHCEYLRFSACLPDRFDPHPVGRGSTCRISLQNIFVISDWSLIELDLNREKPDTLSFQLASFVANVRKLAETIKAKNTRNEPLQLHVGVTTELDGNAFACASDNHQYIGITFGHYLSSAYFSLQSFFMTKAFNDIGTPPDNHASTLELCPETKFWESEGVTTINEFRNIETHDSLKNRGRTLSNLCYDNAGFSS